MFKKLSSFFKKTIPPAFAVAIMALFGVFSVQMVLAFSQPTGAPSASTNVAAPVNVGSASQIKSGALWVGSLGTDGGASFATGKVTVTSGGLVGIGASAPGGKLHIDTTGTDQIRLTTSSANPWDVYANASGFGIYDATNAQTRLFVTNAGNVGIGNTSPSYKLTINSTTAGDRGVNINLSGTGTNYGIVVNNLGAATTNVGLYTDVRNATNNKGIHIDGTPAGANNYAIYSNAAAQSYFAGNVGIGTASPAQKLSVAGTIESTSGGFKFPDGTTQTSAATAGSSYWSASGNNISNSNTGNVGIGTASPIYKLQVHQATNQNFATYGNYNLSNGVMIQSVNDAGGALQGLEMRGSTVRLTDSSGYIILTGGNVGIGMASPTQAKLTINNGGTVPAGWSGNDLVLGNANGYSALYHTAGYAMWYAGTSLGIEFKVNNGGATPMTLTSGGNVGIGTASPGYLLDVNGSARSTGWYTSSDERLKKNIETLTGALSKVMDLRGVYFDWKDGSGQHQAGFIAQEVEKVFPEAVNTVANGYKSVDYSKMTPLLLEAVKELKAENNLLKARVDDLEARLNH